MTDKLSNCPFCRASASIGKIGRDWWELKAEHDDECALDSDHVLRAPQTPEGRAWLVTAWNRRASPAPAISESEDAERLDFMVERQAWIQWTVRDGSIRQCQVYVQDEDENYHILSGKYRYFSTPREAIDAARKGGKS